MEQTEAGRAALLQSETVKRLLREIEEIEKRRKEAAKEEERINKSLSLFERLMPVWTVDLKLAQQIHAHIVSGNFRQASRLLTQFEKANKIEKASKKKKS